MAKKTYEISDAVSMFRNKMQTLTKEVVREGIISDTGIKFEYFDEENALCSCKVDNTVTHILLERESRLPFGDDRKTIVSNGLEWLFQTPNDPLDGKWEYSPDLIDEDNAVKYERKNTFFDSYSEYPESALVKQLGDAEAKFILYFPVDGKQEHVDGIAVLEIGNDLAKKSGLVYYYAFRVIDNEQISTL